MVSFVPLLLALGLAGIVVLVVNSLRKSDSRLLEEDTRRRRNSLAKDLVAAGLVLDREDAAVLFDRGDASSAEALIALLRLGNRKMSRDAVEELGTMGVVAETAINEALDTEQDPDVLVDLRRALRIATGEDENPIVEVFR